MTRKKFTKKLLNLIFAFMLPIISLCTLGTIASVETKADVTLRDFYTKIEDVTNNSFDDISSTYASNNFSGWSLINGNTSATTMTIDTDVQKNYTQYENSTYCISSISNPGAKDPDTKILMINSANKNNNPSSRDYNATSVNEGYKSSDITLKKNSYYILQASFKTSSFPSVLSTPYASIYLEGLKDDSSKDVSLSYEMISSSNWDTVFFFVATGNDDQTVNIELWHGSKENESFGVSFFDAIYLQRCSQNYFYDSYYKEHYSENNFYFNSNATNTDLNGYTYNYYGENENYNNSERPLVQLCEFEKDNSLVSDINLDFEKDNSSQPANLIDWKVNEYGFSEFGNAKIININEESIFTATTGYTSFPGSDYNYKNEKALVLWTKAGKKGYASVVSKDIEIKAHECYKITANVKVSSLVSGSLVFEVKENDNLFTNFPALDGRYTLDSVNSTVSSNGSNEFNNKYAEVEIFIQGHDLYNTTANIVLSLGSSSSEAEGCVIVDSINISQATFEEFEQASTKLKLNTIKTDQTTLSVPNGYFNNAYNISKVVEYPLTASNWELSQNPNSLLYSGVINLYNPYFEELKANYDWATTLSNPAKDKNVVDNVYMMHNPTASYQSITSDSFSILSGNYYALTFDYKTIKTSINKDSNLIINVYDDKTLIYTDTINSSGNWSTYKAYIYAGERATSLKATFAYGTKTALSQGYVFIDNVSFDTTDSDSFASAVRKSDLSGFMINLDPANSVSNNISTAYGWTTSGTNGQAGVIKGKNNDSFGYRNSETIDDGSLENNVLVLTTNATGEMKLTSNIELSLDSDSYYKLSFRILTSLPNYEEGKEKTYGAKILLTNMNESSKYMTSNDGWKEVTMYFHNEDSSTVTSELIFSLTSSNYENFGYAYLTDIKWIEDDSDGTIKAEYEEALENPQQDVYTYAHEATSSDEESDEDATPDTQNDSNNALTIMLYISSAITGLAIVVAILGYTFRKIKIKKVTKTTNADYDRKFAVSQKAITLEAEKLRREEEKEIESQIAEVQAQISELEQKQKSKNNLSRESGKITKGIEREFKSYATKRTRLQDRLNMFNEKLENVKSPEYMLSLERKVASQMMKERRETIKKAKSSK